MGWFQITTTKLSALQICNFARSWLIIRLTYSPYFSERRACSVRGKLARLKEKKEKAVEAAVQNLGLLDKEIQGKKFFGGEQIGYLDLAAGWICHWLNVLDEVGEMNVFDKERVPSLHEWAQNFIQIPVIKESLPPRENLVNYFKGSLSYVRSLAAKK